ncbi:unnamed protein product [Amoebophrya sp. A25]|nr:unnamed protein product [Amoebophrya sp. A25]|eukprot:GSA25T00002709001.1
MSLHTIRSRVSASGTSEKDFRPSTDITTKRSETETMKDADTLSTASTKEDEDERNEFISAHNRMLWREKEPKDFTHTKTPEPHAVRRRQILEKHPEILKLYKPDPLSALLCLGTVAVQLSVAYAVSTFDPSWWVVLVLGYVISGTMNHSLVLAMHELSHDLWFKTKKLNLLFGWFINCPTCVASASTFKRYHLEHHTYQGSEKMDADLPTKLEGKLFRYTATKALWVALQPFFYGLRPILVKPKPVSVNEIINWMVVGTFDLLVMKYLGTKAFVYLFSGSILGLGVHPMAGHFIAEHFEFIEGQETYSYYGPLNVFAYNVGYHNEHHDFPKVPGRLLPKVKAIAPEFYDNLPYYDSWTSVLLGFIFGHNINCFCRVKRFP